jgi:tRNA pseudouridine13 synthase
VRNGTWNRLQPGDIANLSGSGSIFGVDAVDETLAARCARLDIHPTGPMWAAATPVSHGAVAMLEQEVANRYTTLCAGLARAALEPERRALRATVSELHWSQAGSDVRMRFRLPRGAFATAVLHELIENAFLSDTPESGE